MKIRLSPAVIFLILAGLLVVLLLAIPSKKYVVEQNEDKGRLMAATIFPVYDLASRIAGPDLTVQMVMPAGSSPHTYEPTPAQVTALADAKIVFAIGHGLDDWVSQLADAGQAQVVTVDRGITLIETEGEDGDHDAVHEDVAETDHEEADHHGGTDPHYWLDPANAKTMAATIRDELTRYWPESKSDFEANYRQLAAELDQADQQARALLGPLVNRQLVTLHDGWRYFANAYDLTLVGSFEPSAGREPTPLYLAALGQAVKKSGTSVLYSEPQLSTTGLSSFLKDNGLTVATLDPIGGVPGRMSLAEIIVYNAQVIANQ